MIHVYSNSSFFPQLFAISASFSLSLTVAKTHWKRSLCFELLCSPSGIACPKQRREIEDLIELLYFNFGTVCVCRVWDRKKVSYHEDRGANIIKIGLGDFRGFVSLFFEALKRNYKEIMWHQFAKGHASKVSERKSAQNLSSIGDGASTFVATNFRVIRKSCRRSFSRFRGWENDEMIWARR